MKVIDQKNLDIDSIVAALRDGKTIVYPTETCYGLGCDATNQDAVDAVFRIKQRQQDKPLLVVMPDEEMAFDYVEWNGTLEQLSQKYWPGPLTVVAPIKKNAEHLAHGAFAEDGTLAFRITSHPIAFELSASLARPLISTSANIASQASPYDIASVLAMFESQKDQPDIIIDAGELVHKSPSTVVKVAGGEVQVLRQGEVIVSL